MKEHRTLRILGASSLFLLWAATAGAQSAHFPQPIPASHPRIWWNEERIATAQEWFRANHFEPYDEMTLIQGAFEPMFNAFGYVATPAGTAGRETYCTRAFQFAQAALDEILQNTPGNNTCDECRWNGEAIIVIYDWCHDVLSNDQRDTVVSGVNQFLSYYNDVYWGGTTSIEGGATFAESNYFNGYMRNNILWGLASYGENPEAETFLEHGLVARWEEVFLEHTRTRNSAGIFYEGADYGPYMVGYPILYFGTADLLGRDMAFQETDYYRNAIPTIMYRTLPGPTYFQPDSREPKLTIFPYGDTTGGFSVDTGSNYLGGPAQDMNTAEFMTFAAIEYGESPLGALARGWARQMAQGYGGTLVSPYIASIDSSDVTQAVSTLPLDYYGSSGEIAHAYVRTSHSEEATALHLQLVSPPVSGHEHYDSGNWTIWRKGRWLALETHGRASTDFMRGYEDGEGQANTDVVNTVAHNALLFGGQGTAETGALAGRIVRLESAPDRFYVATDLSDAYRAEGEFDESYGNPNADRVLREFLFIRPLETLLILDRMSSAPNGDSTKTFLMHSQTEPVAIADNVHRVTNADQVLELTTLLPADASYRVVDELREYANRLEVETSGTGAQYFLHAVQVRDESDDSVNVTFDDAESFTVEISHPQRGCARAVFAKGLESAGGTFAFAAGCDDLVDRGLYDGIQEVAVTENGVEWAGTEPASPTFVSTALEDAYVGRPYHYSASALGTPAPTYQLVVAPNGMTIDRASGAVSWTPSSVGEHSVTIAAANGIEPDATQSFTVVVHEASAAEGTGGSSGTGGSNDTGGSEDDSGGSSTVGSGGRGGVATGGRSALGSGGSGAVGTGGRATVGGGGSVAVGTGGGEDVGGAESVEGSEGGRVERSLEGSDAGRDDRGEAGASGEGSSAPASGEGDSDGCGCRVNASKPSGMLSALLFALGMLLRRRPRSAR